MGQRASLSLGVNAASLTESNLQTTPATLANLQATNTIGATSQSNPVPLAPWLLAAACILLLVEAALSWR